MPIMKQTPIYKKALPHNKEQRECGVSVCFVILFRLVVIYFT